MKRSPAALLASRSAAEQEAFLDGLSANAIAAMPWLWDLWAHPGHQRPPAGEWTTWVLLGGRGAGKTRAGAEWVRGEAEGRSPLSPGRAHRIALVGETIDQVRDVMVEGESGLLAVCPPDRRPCFLPSLRRLVWPNGAEATLFSAANPEALRGPQFDLAWADELAKWRLCRETWEMLQFCLRLGERPRQVVTTTPRDNPVLTELLAEAGTAVTRATSEANAANLAPGFLERLRARFGTGPLARQELDGEVVAARAGALWQPAMLEAARVAEAPADLDRIVVAVDPPVSSGAGADECGIVTAGIKLGEGADNATYFVLGDATVQGLGPGGWAEAAVRAYRASGADRLVAEVNQGGDLVESVLRQTAPALPYRAVRATRGKAVRAEPVAALYERGRVRHVGDLSRLERQMCQFVPGASAKSPDRMDALVWALTDLMADQEALARPRIGVL